MEKYFNITGTCFPNEHYMADVSGKIEKIKKMVDAGKYFIINRPRQYGKTTTFNTLSQILKNSNDYLVITISFEGIGDAVFLEEKKLSKMFIKLLMDMSKYYVPELTNWLKEAIERTDDLNTLSDTLTELCEQTDKKVVVMIDEVDKSSNNQLFVSFLAMLRNKYLIRNAVKTFHSVVLAGVHDVKSLKLKLRPEDEKKLNSPWNIATDFTIDMNLYPSEIKPMLEEYAHDKGVKMNTKKIAEHLFYFTSGYPFLVSKLCKIVDETFLPKRKSKKWTIQDIADAAVLLTKESNANFDSLTKNLDDNPALYDLVYKVAVENETIPFNSHDYLSNLGLLYGIFVDREGLKIHNLIYNQVITNFMEFRLLRTSKIDKVALAGIDYRNSDLSLNMELVLLKFQSFMKEQFSKKDRDFLEHQGRLVFLAFMKPILNGGGFDFKEPQVSEERRLDVAITYYNHKYVAELKIWRGQSAHEKGLVQLADYLDRQGLTEGYLIIFDHSAIKSWNSERKEVAGKNIFMVWV
jgi:hypothetical protein